MKTYHQYQIESKTAEEALKKVQSQKAKIEQQLSGKSLSGSRKFKKIEKQEDEVGKVFSTFFFLTGWSSCPTWMTFIVL